MVLASTRLHPSNALTSRIILAFAAASNDSNLTVKTAFSAAAGAASSAGSSFAAAAPPAGAPPAAAAATGIAMSAIFNFAFQVSSRKNSDAFTFNCEINSAVSSRVSREISSTIWLTRALPDSPAAAAFVWNRWWTRDGRIRGLPGVRLHHETWLTGDIAFVMSGDRSSPGNWWPSSSYRVNGPSQRWSRKLAIFEFQSSKAQANL
jgi:hypothetical protein